uniref:S-formylglutathione hydrolase n=1 Tax=Cacopsylla melanoneura TaxID=428564 RepID=A0A8D8YAW7_9HEMI
MVTLVSSSKCFGGYQKVYSHVSKLLRCQMKFAIFLPNSSEDRKLPCIYYLSGLTCTEENAIHKSGVQRHCSTYNVIMVFPDTSPRGDEVPDVETRYDLGKGAGFYVDATQEPWQRNYHMFSYVTQELPDVINENFPVLPDQTSIMGHSMGGHGALICGLKCPGKYLAVSAFAPICNPTQCQWGRDAFKAYLGDSEEEWKAYDATELVKKYNGPPLELLIDQGTADKFYTEQKQLLPENLIEACTQAQVPVISYMREGYDHLYYFIATFMEDHIKHHVRFFKSS